MPAIHHLVVPGRRYASTNAATATPVADAAFTYCRDLVSRTDWENYTATLFLPPGARRAAWAIRAFNAETAMIRDAIRDPTSGAGVGIGLMRVQFWRDGIAGLYAGTVREHPVLQALAESMGDVELSQGWFRRILSARQKDLEEATFGGVRDLEAYAENTASSVLYLTLEALGVRSLSTDHVASHVGKAMGIATLVRGLPHHISQRRLMIPSEVTVKHRLSAEDVFRGRQEALKPLEDSIFDVATVANDHLRTAKAHLEGMQATGKLDADCEVDPQDDDAFLGPRPESSEEMSPTQVQTLLVKALLPAVPCQLFLRRLEAARFNVFDPALARRDWKVPFSLWNRGRTKQLLK
ncbi:hypothetical protein HK101_009230 [Irineochytrium annulatum]|nr:hypothetical protein HK101_009230 [Irineochytrium annulatum]